MQKFKSLFYVFFLLVFVLNSCNDTATDKDYRVSAERINDKLTEFIQKDELLQPDRIKELYASRAQEPIWTTAEVRKKVFTALIEAEKEGLSPEDYHLLKLRSFLQAKEPSSPENLAQFEILLTDGLLQYAQDLYYGKTDPTKIHDMWGITRKEINLVEYLRPFFQSEDIPRALEDLKPPYQIYDDLKNALQEYELLKENESGFIQIPEGDLIRPGDRDPRIPVLTKRLIQLELLPENHRLDSIYTPELQEAIETFQKERGLETDAVLGNSTIKELNMTSSRRYEQIRANLERWRWYPRDLGDHYILVNIPAYKLAVVKEGDTIREHAVVAGSPARQTVIFSDTIEYIEVNPQWTVPPTIKVEDIIPKARRNPSYVTNRNMKIIGPSGSVVDPGTVDWSDDQVKNLTFVQRAGPANPLGRVKIMYPNQYLIYLHDTPSKSLFNQNERAESSGCVRVENAIDLATYVLSDKEEEARKKIDEFLRSGQTAQLKVNRPIQVHHFYWTAWRAGNSTVFTSDVYGLDEKLIAALQEDYTLGLR